MTMIEYADREMLAIDVANQLAGDLENSLLHDGQATLAVPGGTTPGPIFDVLCAADLDWARVTVMLTDERWVPEDSPRSNTRLIRERLLTSRAAAASFVPFHSVGETPQSAQAALAARLEPHLPLAVLLLGMGADMHTASLFPGADGLEAALAADAPAALAIRPVTQPEERVTLSLRALNGALCKHLVIFGDEKRAALDRARSLPPEQGPIGSVLGAAKVHWAN